MTNFPQSRKNDLVVNEFETELLIYDLNINKAYCLNETSAMVWNLCDGKKSVAEISRILTDKLQQPITEDVIWLALDGFKKDNLLENSKQFEINFNGLSRRQVIKKVGFASLVTLPVIRAIIAPQAAQAASCVALGQPCSPHNSAGNCCAGQSFCGPFTCDPCVASPNRAVGGCVPNASDCQTLAYVCCSGKIKADSTPCTFGGFACFCN